MAVREPDLRAPHPPRLLDEVTGGVDQCSLPGLVRLIQTVQGVQIYVEGAVAHR